MDQLVVIVRAQAAALLLKEEKEGWVQQGKSVKEERIRLKKGFEKQSTTKVKLSRDDFTKG